MSERVTIDIDNHVATVTLNRADKKNAVDTATVSYTHILAH